MPKFSGAAKQGVPVLEKRLRENFDFLLSMAAL